MGCDIHLHVETKAGESWEHQDEPVYDARNYRAYAVLADVRNGYGFAGSDTGDALNTITPEPRGLPDDATEKTAGDYRLWDGDAHSANWLTLAELMAFDWTQIATIRGVVTLDKYRHFVETGRESPRSWCSGAGGINTKHLTNEEADAMLAGEAPIVAGFHYYTKIQWREQYSDTVGHLHSELMPELQALAHRLELPYESVRAVFWFDN